jgi:hypothetical protein
MSLFKNIAEAVSGEFLSDFFSLSERGIAVPMTSEENGKSEKRLGKSERNIFKQTLWIGRSLRCGLSRAGR